MICVIADDLSGAAELAGVGLRYGLSAEVQLEFLLTMDADLLCVDTDSRSCTAEEAAQRITRLAVLCREAGIEQIFKKVDSVLRGHVVAEIAALMEGLGRRQGLLVPANPKLGRVIRDGQYLVDGVPLHQTGFAQDPKHPVQSSEVLDLLVPSSGPRVRVVTPGGTLPTDGILVGAATSPTDLGIWAKTLDEDMLPAGAAEFFAAFLGELDLRPAQGADRLQFSGSSDRALFVCGSISEQSRAFCQGWRESGRPLLRIPTGLFEGKAQQNRFLEDWASEAVIALQQHRQVMIAIDRPLRREPGVPERLNKYLGAAVWRILERAPVDRIFAEGGATATALARQFGWLQLSAQQELEPGVVCMKPVGGASPWFTIKPGSYTWPAQVMDPGDPIPNPKGAI